jgi:hypothetical protein
MIAAAQLDTTNSLFPPERGEGRAERGFELE